VPWHHVPPIRIFLQIKNAKAAGKSTPTISHLGYKAIAWRFKSNIVNNIITNDKILINMSEWEIEKGRQSM
jgi:hypothetical protein